MFDRRLFAVVDGVGVFVAAAVAFKWIALVADIVFFITLGLFMQGALLDIGAFSEAAASVVALPFLSVSEANAQVLLMVCALAIAVRMAATIAAQRAGSEASARAKRSIRSQVYGKLLRLGPSYVERIPSSQAVQIGVEGVEQLEVYFGSYLPQLFYAILAPITLFAFLAPLFWQAAVLLIVCVPLIPVSIALFQTLAKRVMGRYWGSYLDLGGSFLENIQGLTTLKIYRADGARHDLMNRQAETFRRDTMRVLRMQLNSITIMDVLAYGGAAAGVCMALWQFASVQIGFAAAFSIVFLSAEFFLPMRSLGSLFHTAMNGMAAAERMFGLLALEEPEIAGRKLDGLRCALSAEGVGYSYDGELRVLDGVDFKAEPGCLTAIVGESGSGKSTLAGIFAGRNARYDGKVSVCGVPLGEIERASLSKALVSVSYDSVLFSGTLRDNLLMGNPDADDACLADALRTVRIWNFVAASGGLDMAISEGASNLSGGQRQRIALARALVADAPMYLFDEVTSNVDAESEEAIVEAIQGLAASGKTVVVISHRLSTIAAADAIYVMADGRVAQCGTHGQLMAQSGPYARMVTQQQELEAIARAESNGDDADAGCQDGGETTFRAVDAGGGSAEDANPGEGDIACERQSGRKPSALRTMARMVRLIGPLAGYVALAVLLGVAGFAASMLVTVAGAAGMGAVLTASAAPFGVFACVVAASALIRGPLHYGEQICNHYIAFKLLALIRDKVFAALRRLAPARLEGRGKGDLMSLATSDIELLEVFYAHTVSPVLIAACMACIIAAVLAAISPYFVILALVLYALMAVAVPVVASRACSMLGRHQRDAVGSMNAFMLESLRGLGETIQYRGEQNRANELGLRMDALQRLTLRLHMRTAATDALTDALILAGITASALTGATLLAAGAVDAMGFMVAQAVIMSGFGPFLAVSRLGTGLQQTLASGDRVIELLDEAPSVQEVEDGMPLHGFEGAKVEAVRFSYGDALVLDGVNLDIRPGKVVQICGRSGSGKSTLCKLLMRFWDPQAGSVSMNGCDLRRVNTADLRDVQSFMTQETHLFAGTLRDNIAMVRPGATDAQVLDACRKADLGALLDRLPCGLDTQVGELGGALSGGERQRLGLARVFLHDAPFILLDEPTSNLDALSEAQVLKALSKHREGRAMVLVSHRASTSSLADERITVERGRVC